MRLRRGSTANARRTALAFAVLAGTLGTAPAAVAVPVPPAPGTTAAPAHSDAAGAPRTCPCGRVPTPCGRTARRSGVTGDVALIADGAADPYAVEALQGAAAGGRGAPVQRPRRIGARGGARGARGQANAPRGDPRHALPAGGYTLTAGRNAVTLTGADGDGLFHAVQTLRQLLRPRRHASPPRSYATGRAPPCAASPRASTAPRGRTGSGWPSWTSWAAPSRTATSTPPATTRYRQARWREPYPAERRAEFRELAERARAQPRHPRLGGRARAGDVLRPPTSDLQGADPQAGRDVGAGLPRLPAPVPGRQLQRVALRARTPTLRLRPRGRRPGAGARGERGGPAPGRPASGRRRRCR